ncbi:hypothetical protein AB0B21_21900 [Streptomyces rimosus]|uniref:hypothetical protein n=1 Tax=Streptomyces rimosus TaxID=1927 RepID=UPI000A675764|nr:hypothetical protein [Streptomyces rimosus]
MPKLAPCDTDSLGAQIQRALPRTTVVKSFVTQEQSTIVDPASISGEHTMFVAGEDTGAKHPTVALLKSHGWTDILDLGPLVSARGMGDVRAPALRHRIQPGPGLRRLLRHQSRPLIPATGKETP